MRWIRIPKEHSVQPDRGSYQDWKEQIADEGQHQCVYCAIHDAHFGGLRNFHIEHYRPKSIERFAGLKNDSTAKSHDSKKSRGMCVAGTIGR